MFLVPSESCETHPTASWLHVIGSAVALSTALFVTSQKVKNLVEGDPTSDFGAFVSHYCPGISHEKALDHVVKGKELIPLIKSQKTVAPHTKKEWIAAFTWHLSHLSVKQGKGFTQGMFVFSDPGHLVANWFKETPDCYYRFSTHFPGRVVTRLGHAAAWGIDISNGSLPAGKRTIIFSPLQMACGSEYTMLKYEDHGTRGLDFLPHTLGYFSTFFSPKKAKGYQEEYAPKAFMDEYHAILNTFPDLIKSLTLLDSKKYGLSAVIHAKNLLTHTTAAKALTALCDKILKLYPDAHMRKGDEVIITEM